MELEEMKRTWETLSRRLEKQEIVSRRLLTQTIERRRNGIRTYQYLSLTATLVCLPVFVAVCLLKHLPPAILVPGCLLFLLGMAHNLLTIRRAGIHEDAPLAQQALATLRFRRRTLILTSVLYACVFLWLAALIAAMYGPLAASGRLPAILAVVVCGAFLGAAEIRWIRRSAARLLQSIRDLQEFDEP